MLIEVNVTKEIIDRSTPCNDRTCIVSNAINPLLKEGLFLSTCSSFAEIRKRQGDMGSIRVSQLPTFELEVSEHIIAYDTYKTCTPFSFKTHIEDQYLCKEVLRE